MTTVSAITKEIYEGKIRDQLMNETVALKRIERTSEGITNEVGGKYVVFPIRIGRNAGVGSRLELESLPVAGSQSFKAARVSLKYQYGRVRLSGPTMELAKTNTQAFASAMQLEMDGLKNDIVKDQNRQVYGTTLGAMASVLNAATASNTFDVVNAQYLEVGQVVDCYDITGVTSKFLARTITSVTITTAPAATIVVSGAAFTNVATDIVVRQGSVTREVSGLSAIIAASGIIYNVDPAVDYAGWVSTVNGNAGTNRPLSEGLMILQVDASRVKGGNVSVILCDLSVRRAYFNLLTQQRRFTGTTEFTGGFKGLAFTTDKGDVPVVTDVDCQPNRMYFVDESQIKLYREAEWSFMDRDGAVWSRVQDFDAYEAVYFMYNEIGTHKRNAHALLTDITPG